ncbi:MAG: lamin tail domain-containing protein [Planctomycetes bacterium]|nr:lamin tail domain-containing protein [Planctomycetota bacterium]
MLVDAQGGLLDSVTYGAQILQFSIGWDQLSRGWGLCHPTPGRPNEIALLSDPSRARINEWLAVANQAYDSDFVELLNPTGLPLDIGGFYLTDAPVTAQALCQLPPLTFIGGHDVLVLQADGKKAPGHVDFKLSSDGEMIGLFAGDLTRVDMVQFGDQSADVSQGRSTDVPELYRFFDIPSPDEMNAP